MTPDHGLDVLVSLAYSMLLATAITTTILLCFRRDRGRRLTMLMVCVLLPSATGAAVLAPAAVSRERTFAAIPDDVIRTFLLPRLEHARNNKEFRQQMMAQLRRVCGETFSQVAFETLIDENPRLLFTPGAIPLIRKELKLQPLSREDLAARKALARQLRDAGGNRRDTSEQRERTIETSDVSR